MNKPVALVTGATRGLGFALAKALHAEGYTVYGTSRNPEEHKDLSFMHLLHLDLGDIKSIDELHEQLPEVDLLINSAGYSQIGTVEEASLESIKELFDVNFFNQIYLTQKYIPGMRERRKGKIINITSMAGSAPVPYSTIYASVKSAFDAFSKGLRNELSQFGITVVAVAPFQMNTTIPQTRHYSEESPYKNALLKAKAARDRFLANAEDPDYIAQQVVKILKQSNPRPHIAVGKGAWRKEWLIKFLSNKNVEKKVKRRFDLDY